MRGLGDALPDRHWVVMMLYASYQEDGVDQWNERKFYSEATANAFMDNLDGGVFFSVKEAHMYEMTPTHRRELNAPPVGPAREDQNG